MIKSNKKPYLIRTLCTLVLLLLPFIAFSAFAEDKKSGGNSISVVFAGGCFWCMEPPFDRLKGVLETTSGYMGGHVDNPTYAQVTGGKSGHYEVVRVKYDPDIVSYESLLDVFWRNIDPLDARGQFCDKGPQYLSAIFVESEAQELAARTSLSDIEKSQVLNGEIATKILPAAEFYRAEEYHQDYYLKNPLRYKYYRTACGRDRRLFDVWGERVTAK